MADKFSDSRDESDELPPVDPTGAELADDDLADAADERDSDAPELSDSAPLVDEGADDGYVDDPSTDDINEAKLDRATDEVADEPTEEAGSTAQRRPRSSRPVRRTKPATPVEESPQEVADDAAGDLAGDEADSLEPTPVATRRRTVAKKDHATPKQKSEAAGSEKRTTPVAFVNEAAGELRKVVWPTANQVQQYFMVVLVFVLFIIAFVSLLDLGFGWALLKVFG